MAHAWGSLGEIGIASIGGVGCFVRLMFFFSSRGPVLRLLVLMCAKTRLLTLCLFRNGLPAVNLIPLPSSTLVGLDACMYCIWMLSSSQTRWSLLAMYRSSHRFPHDIPMPSTQPFPQKFAHPTRLVFIWLYPFTAGLPRGPRSYLAAPAGV
jgi:hypothetical protein